MEIEEKTEQRPQLGKLYRVAQAISLRVESFYYNLGLQIARRPKRWMLGCSILVVLCIGGALRFRQEKNPLKLWVPPDSDFIRDTEWLMSTFQEGVKIESFIFTADDVLEPRALLRLNEITARLIDAQSQNSPKIAWTDVCFKVPIVTVISQQLGDPANPYKPGFDPAAHLPPRFYCEIINSLPSGCYLLSIMDIWEFNSTLIGSMTKEGIVDRFNAARVSPTLGHPMNFTELLGGVTRDDSGRIVKARAVKTRWIVHVNFTGVDMDQTGNDAGTADWTTRDVYEWEGSFLRELEEAQVELNQRREKSNDSSDAYSVYYEAGRSFGDISSDSIFHDIDKLVLGIVIMSIYVMLILSKFNWIELRFWLTFVAMFCITGAFIVAIGLCSLAGIPYGPVHTSLPFMLMGLGVDDTFVMMASWEEVNSQLRHLGKPLPERVALALSHAGAAISVTSLTDVVAFVIGASTILPSLNSFCIYAAVGVLVTFVLQVTFFVAFFTLDCERAESKRNGLLPCVTHPSFGSPTKRPHESVSWKVIDALYVNVVLTTPGKLAIVAVTVALAALGAVGSTRLEQWFDPMWFLPKDSYLSEYLAVRESEFPKVGFEANVFVSDVDFVRQFPKILNLSRTMQAAPFAESVKNWADDFVEFVEANFHKDAENGTLAESEFSVYLSKFLYSRVGAKYRRNFRFADGNNLTCGEPAPKLLMASIDFNFVKFTSPYEWIPGMDGAKDTVATFGLDSEGGFVTVWSEVFASWVTDKVISQEVVRNLILALVCVMGMTAILVAELQTCFWILSCVLLTLLDVCGFMYFWGMTIDVVSCIGLELAVGLCVDYAAHVAHAFLNVSSSGNLEPRADRSARALIAVRHIGSAVLFGAGSTLLALSLLSLSRAYVFRTFFKIFLLVIIFGLWHGLLLLPVVLSTIGPRSLRSDGQYVQAGDKQVQVERVDAAAVPLNK
ncbi:protein patched homolog 2-like [Copidosoma floridanum]|uniref:protein patched homolog 2-like n=1 Tax=Copidosoma floridanum TaxID=29053 RepID=UPI0006C984AF|nr:protein patched homolog 2-like [Copidosoma floridanum]